MGNGKQQWLLACRLYRCVNTAGYLHGVSTGFGGYDLLVHHSQANSSNTVCIDEVALPYRTHSALRYSRIQGTSSSSALHHHRFYASCKSWITVITLALPLLNMLSPLLPACGAVPAHNVMLMPALSPTMTQVGDRVYAAGALGGAHAPFPVDACVRAPTTACLTGEHLQVAQKGGRAGGSRTNPCGYRNR